MGVKARVAGRCWGIAVVVLAVAGFTASGAGADYPRVSKRIPARTVFSANRPHDFPIDSIMIHDTEGRYLPTVEAFTGPTATAAVQYVVSGQAGDPAVTQFAADKDWTRSVNNWWFNETSIGVEHIGFAAAPAGYFAPQLYRRSADLVGWVVWKYRIPLDHAHILGHDNIPNSVGDETVQHWDPGPAWDWPYYMRLVRAAYERWSHNAPPPRAEIAAKYTKRHRQIRTISVGHKLDSARDWFLWTTGHQNAFTNVYADHGGRPALNVLVRGASDPSTFIPSSTVGKAPTYD